MKNALLSIFFTLLLVSTLFLPIAFAEDYTQLNLPEGAKLRLGKGWINDIQFSPDGTRLAVASSIGIWLYDAQTYQELSLLTGHTYDVNSIAFSPNGHTIASSGGWDKTIRLWDVGTGRHLRTLTGHESWVTSVTFNPDGHILASGNHDDTIRLWHVDTGSHLHTLTGHTDSVNSVAFSPDARTLASASRDQTVRLWDVGTG